MDPFENMINTNMVNAVDRHDQLCIELLKSLIALNERSGKSIDETAISKLVQEHRECVAKDLRELSFGLETLVTDALQNRRIYDKEKINELANMAKELADAWNDDDGPMKSDVHFGTHLQTTELFGNDLLVYKAIQSFVSEVGISRTELETQFSNIPSHELNRTIEFLCDNGLCYTTIDRGHFEASE